MRQPLNIALDPRVHTSPDDLQAQFALAREIEALRARLATAASTATKGTADSLRAIGAQLAQIEAGVESAPTAPTPEERRAFAAARVAAGAALR